MAATGGMRCNGPAGLHPRVQLPVKIYYCALSAVCPCVSARGRNTAGVWRLLFLFAPEYFIGRPACVCTIPLRENVHVSLGSVSPLYRGAAGPHIYIIRCCRDDKGRCTASIKEHERNSERNREKSLTSVARYYDTEFTWHVNSRFLILAQIQLPDTCLYNLNYMNISS